MSSKNNVNTDHYKTAGRGRQGERLVAEVHKHAFAQASRVLTRLGRRGKPRGLSPMQLLVRRIRERRAKG